MGVELGGMSSVWVPGEGTRPGKTQGTLHVLVLEGKGCNTTGAPGATPTVEPLWDAHAGGAAGETQEDGQM